MNAGIFGCYIDIHPAIGRMFKGFQLHKVVHGPENGSLCRFMVPVKNTGRAHTRGKSNNNMVIPQIRTNMGQKGICFRGPSFWNRLPNDLKVVRVFRSFERLLSGMVHQLFGDHPT